MDEERLIKEANKDGYTLFAVAGIIRNNRRFLLLRRKTGDSGAGIYEFPKGGVETGESLFAALKREIKEESGLDMIDAKYLNYVDIVTTTGHKVRIFNFLASVKTYGSIMMTEHDDYKWITKDEVDDILMWDNVKDNILRL